MESAYLWNMLYVCWREVKLIGVTLLAIFACHQLSAQFNVRKFDEKYALKHYHFGIVLAYHQADFYVFPDQELALNDSVLSLGSQLGPGFTMGIIGNYTFNKYFDARVIPGFSFSDRRLLFNEREEEATILQPIESIHFEVPMLLKFKSEAYYDFRLYVLGGLKYSIDLASNANSRNTLDVVKIERHDITADYGIGIEFYFPMFILAPELRISQGLVNLHRKDESLRYSRSIDRLRSRMILFSLNF